jgi:hypothetical protein
VAAALSDELVVELALHVVGLVVDVGVRGVVRVSSVFVLCNSSV